jgi:hypothetical protein
MKHNCFIPDHASGFTGIGLPVENTLILLAFGFEPFAFRQDTHAFSPPDGFPG